MIISLMERGWVLQLPCEMVYVKVGQGHCKYTALPGRAVEPAQGGCAEAEHEAKG